MRYIGVLSLIFLAATATLTGYFARREGLASLQAAADRATLILALMVAANIAIRGGVWLLRKYSTAKDKAEIKQITSIYKYAIWLVLIFTIMAILFKVIGAVITSIGLLAASLALALQRPILNLAGLLSIVTKRPFRIGDRVDIGSVGGYVHEIALMHTHLSVVEKEEQTGKVAYVPNEQAVTQLIINYTRGSNLVWDQVRVRVPLSADLAKIEKRMLECVTEVTGKVMREASRKWKTDVTPQARAAIDYVGNQPFVEISARYMASAKELAATKTVITKKIISRIKKEIG